MAEARAVREDSREVLVFVLGSEEYAVDILKVQEIRGYEKVTPIPAAPAYLKGVVNLRGIIVPVIDMRMVNTLSALKPGSTRLSATADRMSKAEPTSKVSASATSVTTRIDRVLFCRNPVPDRPPVSFNVEVRSAFEL